LEQFIHIVGTFSRHSERWHPIQVLSFHSQRLTTSRQHAYRRIGMQKHLGHAGRCVDHVLAIVEHEHQLLPAERIAVVRVEQLYPWPEGAIADVLGSYPNASEVIWLQEEPENMGALSFVMPRLKRLARDRQVLSIKRSAAASPATGSAKAHEMEQKTVIELALSSGLSGKVSK